MENKLVCDFCDKQFKREVNYLKHKCEQMKRYDLFKKPIGMIAYLTFNQWRKIQNYPSVNVETFTSSRYFNAFIKFAEFSRQQQIPDKIGYISLMVKKGLLPFHWSDADVYDYYLETFDAEYTVDNKIDISIETLQELAHTSKCELNEVFNNITPITVLKYITARKLSPWLLLPSKKFMDFMTYKTNKEERLLFSTLIDVSLWKKHFVENPEKVNEIKNINKQLGI